MTKQELADQILDSLTVEDWEILEDRNSQVPVSAHNRETLLALRDTETEFDGEIEEERIEEAKALLGRFLEEHWAEQPAAHKYVTAASLALAFVLERPMHAWDAVHYAAAVQDEKVRYYCAYKEGGTICDHCPTRHMEEITPLREAKMAAVAEQYGDVSAEIMRTVFAAGFSDAGILPVEKIRCHEEVRKICEENRCRAYGRTWACPPAVGTLEECSRRVSAYRYMQLFSRAYRLEDEFDFDGMKDAMMAFKKAVDELAARLEEKGWSAGSQEQQEDGKSPAKLQLLSNESCTRCKTCTYPDAPCRFPDRLYHTIEGYGYYVSELAAQAGIPYMNGRSTVTFFGAVLYGNKDE